MPAGRKSKYETNVKPNLMMIRKWKAEDQLTEAQIAKKLGVAMSSFSEYKLKYTELMDVLHASNEELVEVGVSELMKNVKAGKEQSIFFLLERKAPKTWGKPKENVDLNVKGTLSIESIIEKLSGDKH